MKTVFGHFLKKILTKNSVFFGARSPSKLVYIGAKGAFRKILGSVCEKWISEKVSKGGPFGSAGGRIPEGGRPPPPPPKSAPGSMTLLQTSVGYVLKFYFNYWCSSGNFFLSYALVRRGSFREPSIIFYAIRWNEN